MRIARGTLAGDNTSVQQPVILSNGATFEYTSSVNRTFNEMITGNGNLLKTGSGRLTINSAPNYTGATVVQAGVLSFSNPNNLTSDIEVQSGAELWFGNTPDRVYNGNISGAGGVLKAGNGTLSLNGANSYSGTTTISGGTLSVSQPSLSDENNVVIADDAILDMQHTSTDIVDQLILDGFSRGVGTHGAIGSGADFEWGQITGSGLLEVTTFSGLAGDYNADGVVNAADYTVWRNNVGMPAGTLVNDPNQGLIGGAQYGTWVASFGQAVSASIAVPEPSGLVLLLLSGLVTFHRRSR